MKQRVRTSSTHIITKIKIVILQCWSKISNPEYRLIKRSGLFDRAYYLSKGPDLEGAAPDLLYHYLKWGGAELRHASIFFDPEYYMWQLSPGEKNTKHHPLIHFLKEGWLQGKNPNPGFCTDYYLNRHPEIRDLKINPLVYYIKQGWKQEHCTSPEMAVLAADMSFAGLIERDINPLAHFLARKPYPCFDPDWYLDRTPFFAQVTRDCWDHYKKCGADEEKSPVPVFDPHFYRLNNSDIPEGYRDLYFHYLSGKRYERVRPSKWFDPAFYIEQLPIQMRYSMPPLEHYLKKGVYERRYTDRRVAALRAKPLISVIVPVYNVNLHYLNNCIRSVLYQTYPNWELFLVDDCSSDPHVRPLLGCWGEKDERINVVYLETNGGIAEATSRGVELAAGDYLAFLDNDDELASDALYHVVGALLETGAELVYSDEDLIGDDGSTLSTFYKPDYNPELLLCHNYITHLLVTSRDLFTRGGGLLTEMDGAQDYDLVLKLSAMATKVHHIPQVLYHWRASETSTSINHQQKQYADVAGKRSVERALERMGREGQVLPTDWKFYYQPKFTLHSAPLISIITVWQGNMHEGVGWVDRFCRQTAYNHFQLIIVLTEKNDLLAEAAGKVREIDSRVKVLLVSECDSQTTLYNRALQYAAGEYIAFISPSIEVCCPGWIEALLQFAQFEDSGFVGGRILLPKNAVEPFSAVPDISCESPLYYLQWLAGCSQHMNGLQCSQEIQLVTGEFCLVRRSSLEKCGGLSADRFPYLFAFADLSLRFCDYGLRNIYSATCVATRVSPFADNGQMFADNLKTIREQHDFQNRWRSVLQVGDSFYNAGCYRAEGLSDDQFKRWYLGT